MIKKITKIEDLENIKKYLMLSKDKNILMINNINENNNILVDFDDNNNINSILVKNNNLYLFQTNEKDLEKSLSMYKDEIINCKSYKIVVNESSGDVLNNVLNIKTREKQMLAKFDKNYKTSLEKNLISNKIKIANIKDSQKIYEFYKNNTDFNYTMEKINKKLQSKENKTYIYEENNCIISIAQIKNEKNFKLLIGCATHKEFRKKGFARLLLEYVCNKNSQKDIYLVYNREKKHLNIFYEKVNFKNIVEMELGYYE